jgi:three-Cys-motif partner protein
LATKRHRGTVSTDHRFGGDWTTEKLAVLKSYLERYTTALKNQPSKEKPFRKAYIDAFAGTGYREAKERKVQGVGQGPLFPDLAGDEPQALLDGSARLALKTEPRFDKYIFIERSPKRSAALEALRAEFPAAENDIEVRVGDANTEIRKLCKKDWRSNRAVLFLDPYGMQVEWETIVAIASTKAIDMWLLFPLGIGLNRLLTRSGDIPKTWRERIDKLLGNKDWYDAFYRVETTKTLFGDEDERLVKEKVETIGRYFNDRLKTVFCAVADTPKVLRNSANCPLYLLCFAANNPRGGPIAVRIANHLLREAGT